MCVSTYTISTRHASKKRAFHLNQDAFDNSFTVDIAFDPERRLLYVLDQANFRLVTFDIARRRVMASLRLGRLPFAVALSPDRRRAYITNIGMFEYKAVPGADPKRARETGLPFPAFGFPSPEAVEGAKRTTATGQRQVPGLADPNVNESHSHETVKLANPAAPR